MGLNVLFALVANGATVSAALTAVYGVVGGGLLSLLGSAALSSAINAVFGPSFPQQDVRLRVNQQKELPNKRHLRGRCFGTGTPSPGVTVDGFYYVSYLFNSRESAGNFELYLDGRVVQATGDPYNLDGAGASATNGLFSGHVTYWIGRGDQTKCPDVFVNEAGVVEGNALREALGWAATDAGRGCTIVWLKLKRGTDGTFQDRWPSYPYVTATMLGDWSKVWDPRDPDQTSGDTTTHTFSRNQALHALDLAMRNPFRPYPETAVDIAQFSLAADVADQTVALKSGGSEPRYCCDGTTLFDGSELEQLMQPILAVGASSLVRSAGRLGIIPGAAKNVALTISDMVGADDRSGGLPTASMIAPPEQQFDEVHVFYSPLERDGEPASLKPWSIPGVVGAGLPRVLTLDLSMCSSATQAMRVRSIEGLKTTYQRKLDGIAWPETIEALTGSWVTMSLGYTKLDGTFEITSMSPLASPVGDEDGIAYRVPISLTETAAAIYAWNPLVDEEDVEHPDFVYDEDGVAAPGVISIVTGNAANVNTGGSIVPRVRYSFAPSSSPNISSYNARVTPSGENEFTEISISPDAVDSSGDIFVFVNGVAGQAQDFDVRAVSAAGFSDYTSFTGAIPSVSIDLDVPTIDSATGRTGRIVVRLTAPNDNDVRRIEVFESDTDDETAAVLFFDADATNNQEFTVTLNGLGSSVTKYFFARTRGDFGTASAFTDSESATTNA